MNYRNLLLSLLFVFLTLGCSQKRSYKLYSDTNLPDSQISELNIPVHVELLRFDGKNAPLVGMILGGHLVNYRILPGEHKLKLRYREVWSVRDEDIVTVQSLPIIKEVSIKPGAIYHLNHRELKDVDDAREFAKNLEFTLTGKANPNPEPITAKGEAIESYSFKQPDLKSDVLVAEEDESLAAIPEVAAAPEVTEEAKEQLATKEDLPKAASDTDLLKYWWSQASEEEKKNFENWRKEQ